jgi:hypothetical protein
MKEAYVHTAFEATPDLTLVRPNRYSKSGDIFMAEAAEIQPKLTVIEGGKRAPGEYTPNGNEVPLEELDEETRGQIVFLQKELTQARTIDDARSIVEAIKILASRRRMGGSPVGPGGAPITSGGGNQNRGGRNGGAGGGGRRPPSGAGGGRRPPGGGEGGGDAVAAQLREQQERGQPPKNMEDMLRLLGTETVDAQGNHPYLPYGEFPLFKFTNLPLEAQNTPEKVRDLLDKGAPVEINAGTYIRWEVNRILTALNQGPVAEHNFMNEAGIKQPYSKAFPFTLGYLLFNENMNDVIFTDAEGNKHDELLTVAQKVAIIAELISKSNELDTDGKAAKDVAVGRLKALFANEFFTGTAYGTSNRLNMIFNLSQNFKEGEVKDNTISGAETQDLKVGQAIALTYKLYSEIDDIDKVKQLATLDGKFLFTKELFEHVKAEMEAGVSPDMRLQQPYITQEIIDKIFLKPKMGRDGKVEENPDGSIVTERTFNAANFIAFMNFFGESSKDNRDPRLRYAREVVRYVVAQRVGMYYTKETENGMVFIQPSRGGEIEYQPIKLPDNEIIYRNIRAEEARTRDTIKSITDALAVATTDEEKDFLAQERDRLTLVYKRGGGDVENMRPARRLFEERRDVRHMIADLNEQITNETDAERKQELEAERQGLIAGYSTNELDKTREARILHEGRNVLRAMLRANNGVMQEAESELASITDPQIQKARKEMIQKLTEVNARLQTLLQENVTANLIEAIREVKPSLLETPDDSLDEKKNEQKYYKKNAAGVFEEVTQGTDGKYTKVANGTKGGPTIDKDFSFFADWMGFSLLRPFMVDSKKDTQNQGHTFFNRVINMIGWRRKNFGKNEGGGGTRLSSAGEVSDLLAIRSAVAAPDRAMVTTTEDKELSAADPTGTIHYKTINKVIDEMATTLPDYDLTQETDDTQRKAVTESLGKRLKKFSTQFLFKSKMESGYFNNHVQPAVELAEMIISGAEFSPQEFMVWNADKKIFEVNVHKFKAAILKIASPIRAMFTTFGDLDLAQEVRGFTTYTRDMHTLMEDRRGNTYESMPFIETMFHPVVCDNPEFFQKHERRLIGYGGSVIAETIYRNTNNPDDKNEYIRVYDRESDKIIALKLDTDGKVTIPDSHPDPKKVVTVESLKPIELKGKQVENLPFYKLKGQTQPAGLTGDALDKWKQADEKRQSRRFVMFFDAATNTDEYYEVHREHIESHGHGGHGHHEEHGKFKNIGKRVENIPPDQFESAKENFRMEHDETVDPFLINNAKNRSVLVEQVLLVLVARILAEHNKNNENTTYSFAVTEQMKEVLRNVLNGFELQGGVDPRSKDILYAAEQPRRVFTEERIKWVSELSHTNMKPRRLLKYGWYSVKRSFKPMDIVSGVFKQMMAA